MVALVLSFCRMYEGNWYHKAFGSKVFESDYGFHKLGGGWDSREHAWSFIFAFDT